MTNISKQESLFLYGFYRRTLEFLSRLCGRQFSPNIKISSWGLWGWSICLQCGRPGFNLWVRRIRWRRKWQPTPVLRPGSYSPWDGKQSHTIAQLHVTWIRLLAPSCCKVIWQYVSCLPNQSKTGLAIHVHRALSTDTFA